MANPLSKGTIRVSKHFYITSQLYSMAIVANIILNFADFRLIRDHMFIYLLQEILLNPNNLPKNPVLQVLVSFFVMDISSICCNKLY
jgi:hypothetical protein